MERWSCSGGATKCTSTRPTRTVLLFLLFRKVDSLLLRVLLDPSRCLGHPLQLHNFVGVAFAFPILPSLLNSKSFSCPTSLRAAMMLKTISSMQSVEDTSTYERISGDNHSGGESAGGKTARSLVLSEPIAEGLPGWCEFAEFVADHFFGNGQRNVMLAIVYQKLQSASKDTR